MVYQLIKHDLYAHLIKNIDDINLIQFNRNGFGYCLGPGERRNTKSNQKPKGRKDMYRLQRKSIKLYDHLQLKISEI